MNTIYRVFLSKMRESAVWTVGAGRYFWVFGQNTRRPSTEKRSFLDEMLRIRVSFLTISC